MRRTRTTFRLPFRVRHGSTVFNEFGADVGQVVEVAEEGQEDTAGNMTWEITADVLDSALDGKLQCMEQLGPA